MQLDPGGGIPRRRRHRRAAWGCAPHGRGDRLSGRRNRDRPFRASVRSTGSTTSSTFLKFGEFGVVMLLFVIGLELRPVRLWSMRSSIFGLGTLQLVTTSLWCLAPIGLAVGLSLAQALFVGLALSLSSTAFALQVLEEKQRAHDAPRAARLLRAAVPGPRRDSAHRAWCRCSPPEAPSVRAWTCSAAGLAIVTILGVVVAGRFLLSRLYRLVAATGRSRSDDGERAAHRGRRGAGHGGGGPVGRARRLHRRRAARRSEYRHQIEADIAPFEGLLLGLFFIAVGMSIDLTVLLAKPMASWPSLSASSRSRLSCFSCSADGGA